MTASEVSTSVVKCSEELSNRVSNIIRRYIDHMQLLLNALSFIIFFYILLFTLFIIYMYSYCDVFFIIM
jgi:lipopolysaccharide/colanic/teichoic acid biosynthesis glycosyltransferase